MSKDALDIPFDDNEMSMKKVVNVSAAMTKQVIHLNSYYKSNKIKISMRLGFGFTFRYDKRFQI